jgi:hypothetical protein
VELELAVLTEQQVQQDRLVLPMVRQDRLVQQVQMVQQVQRDLRVRLAQPHLAEQRMQLLQQSRLMKLPILQLHD